MGCASPYRKLVERVTSHPAVFDWIQHRLGLRHTHGYLRPYVVETDDRIVLDIGAGTGIHATLLAESATYVALEINLRRLETLRARHPHSLVVACDATAVCLQDNSVDYALCLGLAHHLPDTQLRLLFMELARVTRERLIFLDPVECKESRIGNVLWRYDRGRYPRSADALCAAIEQWFEIEDVTRYAIFHEYILCAAKPKHIR